MAKRYSSLADYFERSGESRASAAARWNVTEATISRWIAGTRQPDAEQMLQISADTGVPVEALVRTAAGEVA